MTSVDHDLLLLTLAKEFNSTLGVKLCKNTLKFIDKQTKIFRKLTKKQKKYYNKYAQRIVKSFSKYLDKINSFEINIDDEPEIIHDFRLYYQKKNYIAHISLDHKSINTSDIIPERLMKICHFRKNSNICKAYLAEYEEITTHIYKKIKSADKYSELSIKKKNNIIFKPICNLVVDTLSRKRKMIDLLKKHLFDEPDRIVLKLYKNRFYIYDFGKELQETKSFSMKLTKNIDNEVNISFQNGMQFKLVLKTNAVEIKEHISIKFHTEFVNLDDLFCVIDAVV